MKEKGITLQEMVSILDIDFKLDENVAPYLQGIEVLLHQISNLKREGGTVEQIENRRSMAIFYVDQLIKV